MRNERQMLAPSPPAGRAGEGSPDHLRGAPGRGHRITCGEGREGAAGPGDQGALESGRGEVVGIRATATSFACLAACALLLTACAETPSGPPISPRPRSAVGTSIRVPTPRAKLPIQSPHLAQLPISPAGRKPDIPVLMYHDVLPQKQVWFDETLADFRRQMAEIHRRGFQVITALQLWRHLTTGAPVPARSIVLTFDDGSEGQFRYAIPVLRQYHYPATFFVHTGYVGVKTGKDHVTWAQWKQAEATGLFDVEGRTVTHPCNMPDLSKQQLARELRGGMEAVQQHLGHRSLFFAYPCGHFNARAKEAVRQAGYILAFDEERGFANLSPSIFAVNRFTPRRLEEALGVRAHQSLLRQ